MAGIITSAGSALGASAAGQVDIAVGVLALTALALAGDLLAAALRDETFRRIATKPKPELGVLRELNIREAIRSGHLSSEDAANLLGKTPHCPAKLQ
jgi:hypothetical protein